MTAHPVLLAHQEAGCFLPAVLLAPLEKEKAAKQRLSTIIQPPFCAVCDVSAGALSAARRVRSTGNGHGGGEPRAPGHPCLSETVQQVLYSFSGNRISPLPSSPSDLPWQVTLACLMYLSAPFPGCLLPLREQHFPLRFCSLP